MNHHRLPLVSFVEESHLPTLPLLVHIVHGHL